MRTDIIATKTRQVQQELIAWAKEKGVLDPGEQIVFTLRVEPVQTVVCGFEDVQKILAMKPDEFFTERRLTAAGCPQNLLRRTTTCFLWEISERQKASGKEMYSMSEFLQDFPSRSHIYRIPTFGRKTVEILTLAIQRAGLPFK